MIVVVVIHSIQGLHVVVVPDSVAKKMSHVHMYTLHTSSLTDVGDD